MNVGLISDGMLKKCGTGYSRAGIFFALAIGLTSAATAQDEHDYTKQFAPPEATMVANTGVDIASGQYREEGLDLDTPSGLSVKRVPARVIPSHTEVLGNYALEMQYLVAERLFDEDSSNALMGGNDHRIGVRFGATSASFDSLVDTF